MLELIAVAGSWLMIAVIFLAFAAIVVAAAWMIVKRGLPLLGAKIAERPKPFFGAVVGLICLAGFYYILPGGGSAKEVQTEPQPVAPQPETKVKKTPERFGDELDSRPIYHRDDGLLVTNNYQPLKDGENIIALYQKKRYSFQVPRNRHYTLTFSTKSGQGTLAWRFPLMGKAVVLHESGGNKNKLELGDFEGHRFFEIELTSDDLGMINIQVEKSG